MRDPVTGEEIATELIQLLRERGIERVLVCGLATDYCVRETAIDSIGLGYETSLLADAVAAVNLQPDDGEKALGEMTKAGVTLV